MIAEIGLAVGTAILAIGALLMLWRAIKVFNASREQSRVTVALVTDMVNDIKAVATALDEREARIVERVADIRAELTDLEQKVQPLTKLVR